LETSVEMLVELFILLAAFAFACEFVDSSLGMGYGTTLTPVLMLFGFSPIQIVPAVLISELFSGLLAGLVHHYHGNVNLKPATADIFRITNMLSPLGYVEKFKKTVPHHLKIALLLSVCSVAGTVAAVFVAVNIPRFWLKLYIGCLVLAMGITIIICLSREFKFSWHKVTFLGLLASFNKGMSGGGYGPVVTGGQILSGVEGKSAVGITSLAEGMTCLVGVITYGLVASNPFDWKLASCITVGALLSVPFTAIFVKKISDKNLRLAIAILTIALGSLTIIRTLT
jgi:uncharacterized membrane protein YfcA